MFSRKAQQSRNIEMGADVDVREVCAGIQIEVVFPIPACHVDVFHLVFLLPESSGKPGCPERWKAGDKINLVLPMKIQRIKASDKIEATKGRVALRYGPLIYCAEKVDQDLNNILSSDSALTAAVVFM